MEAVEESVRSETAGRFSDEERQRRLRETLADVYYGGRGYEIQKHIERMAAGPGPL